MASAVSKEFGSVPKLEPNGANYCIWINRVKMSIRTCKAAHVIDHNIVRIAVGAASDPGYVAATNDKLVEVHDYILNSITQKFHNAMFLKYMEQEQVHGVLEGLKAE